MATKRKGKNNVKNTSKKCHECSKAPERLPGYILVALGALWLPANYGMIPGMEWTKAAPLLFVLVGVVLVARATLHKD